MMFLDIAQAYEILSDTEFKGKYDRGEEVFENQAGGGGDRHFNPIQFYQQQHTQFHFRHVDNPCG
jgi:DnaJ-class molecular chaperone